MIRRTRRSVIPAKAGIQGSCDDPSRKRCEPEPSPSARQRSYRCHADSSATPAPRGMRPGASERLPLPFLEVAPAQLPPQGRKEGLSGEADEAERLRRALHDEAVA